MARVLGCHMVGSVPLPDTESVLRQCSASQPNRLKRIPDGETGLRNFFTFWQAACFQASPELVTKFSANNQPIPADDFTEEEIEAGVEKLRAAGPLETNYDNVAIQSYGVFKNLKDEGALPKDIRFQMSIVTAPNTLTPFVQYPFQAKVEPLYQDALDRAIRKVQDHVPHNELAIELDLAVDTAFYEGHTIFKPWFGDGDQEKIKEYIVNYIVHQIGQVEKDVEVGLHNCYGDMEHRHWVEPTSLAGVVDRGIRIFEKTPHPINFFHAPVPKSALDKLESYLVPLQKLIPKFKEHGTDLYLGVIHYDDRSATQKMIEAAKVVLGDYPFGVATECGWGRTPPEQIEDIMKITTEVSEPVF